MRKVTLIFPDISSLSEFILSFKISKAIVDSAEMKLTGVMPDKNLHVARSIYGAIIRESVAIKHF